MLLRDTTIRPTPTTSLYETTSITVPTMTSEPLLGGPSPLLVPPVSPAHGRCTAARRGRERGRGEYLFAVLESLSCGEGSTVDGSIIFSPFWFIFPFYFFRYIFHIHFFYQPFYCPADFYFEFQFFIVAQNSIVPFRTGG